MRYQKINIRIWNDEKFGKMEAETQRVLLYLLTCPHSNIVGFYVLKPGYATDDLRLSSKEFLKHIKKICDSGIAYYDEADQVVIIKNYLLYNPITNPNQLKAAKDMVLSLPKTHLFQEFMDILEGLPEGLTKGLLEVIRKDFGKPTVTVTDTVKDIKKNNSIPYTEIIEDLNQLSGKHFIATEDVKKLIRARFNDGFRVEHFHKVHRNKVASWKNDPEYQKWLRPQTLYTGKFQGYLNETPSMADQGKVSKTLEKSQGALNRFLNRDEGKENGDAV